MSSCGKSHCATAKVESASVFGGEALLFFFAKALCVPTRSLSNTSSGLYPGTDSLTKAVTSDNTTLQVKGARNNKVVRVIIEFPVSSGPGYGLAIVKGAVGGSLLLYVAKKIFSESQ